MVTGELSWLPLSLKGILPLLWSQCLEVFFSFFWYLEERGEIEEIPIRAKGSLNNLTKEKNHITYLVAKGFNNFPIKGKVLFIYYSKWNE